MVVVSETVYKSKTLSCKITQTLHT